MTEKPAPVTIGAFQFHPTTGELSCNSITRRLRPQAARALAILVERAGEMVSREELRAAIWPNTRVEFDLSLNVCIRQIRAALDDDAEAPRYIETLPRRGYRLIAPVTLNQEAAIAPGHKPFVRTHRWLVAAVPAAALLAMWWWPRDPGEATIAVLPFRSIPAADTLAYLEDGLTEELITSLTRVAPDQLQVIARTSAFAVAARADGPLDVGAELGADYILQGALRSVDTGFRITVQLLETASGSYRWSESYDITFPELLSLERTVAARVTTALAHELGTELPAPVPAPPVPPATRDAVLRARFLLDRFTRSDAEHAIHLLEQARTTDSMSVELFVALARARLQRGEIDAAEAAITRARALDAERPDVDGVAGQIALYGRSDVSRASTLFARAVARDPGAAELRRLYANALVAEGRTSEAVAHGRRALEIDPVSSTVRGDIGWVFYYAKQYDEAIRTCRSTLELVPESVSARACVILASTLSGSLPGAADIVDSVLGMLGASNGERAEIQIALRQNEVTEFWRWLLASPIRRGEIGRVKEARTLALLGRHAEAAALIRELSLERPSRLLFVTSDPMFDELRGLPDFEAAVRQISALQGSAS